MRWPPRRLAWAVGDATDRRRPPTAEPASKLTALIEQLTEIGVGPRSDTRVVVFSERIATLDWLAAHRPAALKLKDKQVRVLHGGMADVKQMDVIEEFGLADSDGPPAVHRRHGLGGREPAPPVPSPDPLRPAVVAHHHRAAQRPHRPLRPAHGRPTSGPCC